MHPSVTLFTPHKAPLHSWGHLRRHNEYKQITPPFLPTQREPSPGVHLTIISTEPNPQPTAIMVTDLCCAPRPIYFTACPPRNNGPLSLEMTAFGLCRNSHAQSSCNHIIPCVFFFFVLTWPRLGRTHQPRRRRTSTASGSSPVCVQVALLGECDRGRFFTVCGFLDPLFEGFWT